MIPELIAAMTGALAVFIGVGALTGQFGYSQRKIAARAVTLQRHGFDSGQPQSVGNIILKEDSLAGNESVSRFLGRFTWASEQAKRLDQADVALKVSEFVLISIGLFAGIAILVTLISGLWPVGLAFGAVAVLGFDLWVRSRARSRLRKFNSQLPIALQSMSVSLQSGFGIMEAVATVCREMDAPIREEFQRVLDEARIGGSFESGLQSMVERVDSADLRIVARALEIHRKVGGDLAQILDQVSSTMRERDELRGHIMALTAQQRFGGMLVGLLPVWVVGFFAVADPDFISPLWEETTGRVLLALGVCMEIVAFFAMRRITAIKV
jgi:tight adherence protein B